MLQNGHKHLNIFMYFGRHFPVHLLFKKTKKKPTNSGALKMSDSRSFQCGSESQSLVVIGEGRQVIRAALHT